MTALTISATISAASSPPKSSAIRETTREARRSVSIRSRNESSGGRLRRTSTGGSTIGSPDRVDGSGIFVWALATGFKGCNALRAGESRAFWRSGRPEAGQRGDARRLHRAPEPLAQLHGRFPAEQLAGERDVGLADLRIVGRQRLEDDLRPRAGDLDHRLGQLEQRELVRVADVHRLMHPGLRQADDPVDQVADVTERAGLGPV